MFYVYDIEGLRFQGTLEELENNRRVERSRAVRPLRDDEQPSSSGMPSAANAQAVRTYQQIINRENMVEPLVHIFQIMSSPVSTIGRDIPLFDAWQMLKDTPFRQLVVNTVEHAVVGVLSDRDIFHHLNADGDEIEVDGDLLVGDIIAEEIYSTDSISDIRRVARAMANYHLDAMPVIENSRLVGIVTRGDILRGFAANPKLNLWA